MFTRDTTFVMLSVFAIRSFVFTLYVEMQFSMTVHSIVISFVINVIEMLVHLDVGHFR